MTVLEEGVDLVERLRQRTLSRKSVVFGIMATETRLDPLCQEAANEITRLREEVEGLRKGLGVAQSQPCGDGERPAPTEAEPSATPPCTCHPDDNPPKPCARQYALSACRMAAAGPILALADAWASIDGKLEKYRSDDGSDPALGYREGYEIEAASLIERLARRGYLVVAGPEAASPASRPPTSLEDPNSPTTPGVSDRVNTSSVAGSSRGYMAPTDKQHSAGKED